MTFYDLDALGDTCRNMITKPDLLILDYQSINHVVFSFYNYLESIGSSIPFIFYNDPYPPQGARVRHWETTLATIHFDSFAPEKYHNLFVALAHAIESEQLHPYIPLLQPAQEAPAFLQSPFIPETHPSEIASYCEQLKLQYAGKILFTILFLHRHTSSPISTLQQKLQEHGISVTVKHTYNLLYRLREKCNKSKLFTIIHTSTGYRLIGTEV